MTLPPSSEGQLNVRVNTSMKTWRKDLKDGNTSSSGSGTSLAAVSTPASLVAVSTPAASSQSFSILDCVPPECESIVIEAGGTVS